MIRWLALAFSILCGSALAESTSVRSSLTNNSIVVYNGLIGYWRMGSPDIAGTTMFDRSRKGLNATLTGVTVSNTIPGQINGAMNFTGSGKYLSTAAQQWPQNGYSAFAWIKVVSQAQSGGIISQYSGGTSTPLGAYSEFFVGNNLSINASMHMVVDTSYIAQGSSASVVPSGKWCLVGFTWDGGTTTASIRLYLNGALISSTPSSGGSFTGPYAGTNIPTTIGNIIYNSVYSNQLTGSIDNALMFNRQLSSAEISDLYISGLSGHQ
jgi:hypothetical protein